MKASLRSLCLVGAVALVAGCQNRTEADNLAALDAKLTGGANAAQANAADAGANAADLGQLEKAPPAVAVQGEASGNRTLGELARWQASGKPVAGADGSDCARSVKSGPEWADRLPEPFRIYPDARVVEAAGLDKERCRIVIVSFATRASIDQVMDFYYTTARRAGFDGEHLLSGTEHQLGGTNEQDGAAYVVFARPGEKGETEVDLVANLR